MKTEKRLEEVLNEKIIGILEENGVSFELYEQDGKYYAELEWITDLQGDQLHTVWFDKDDPDATFAADLREVYHDFDIDEYVEMWLEAKRNNPHVCHLTARQLVQDGEQIEEFLDELSRKVWLAA